MDTELDLRGKGAFGDLAIDGRAGKTGALQNGSQPDDAVGDCHGFGSTGCAGAKWPGTRSEEHTSELQSLMRISYAVFCLKQKRTRTSIPSTECLTRQRETTNI